MSLQKASNSSANKIIINLIPVLVFFSGFCSLVYQVSWERIIKFSLGGDQVSSFVVTSSFLLGLGLGAFLFRKSFKNPLRGYAFIEFLISIFAFLSYYFFTELITYANQNIITIENIEYLRLNTTIISFILLIIPCILIGGTMPVFFDSFFRNIEFSNKKLGIIYGLNTLGACLGIASIPLIFFNNISIPNTLYIVGFINLIISISLFLLSAKKINSIDSYGVIRKLKISNFNINSYNNLDKQKSLLISFISGGTVLLMELVFFRLASTNWPSSSYNFPIIMMVFLFFLSIGSIYFSSITKESISKSKKLLSNLFIYSILSVILTIYIQNNFITNSIIEIILKYTLLVAPFAFFQGGIFPILLHLNTYHSENISKSTGSLYLVNSLGAFFIAGISQFILFKIIGLRGVVYFIICLYIISIFIIYINEFGLNKFKNRITLSLLALLVVISLDKKTWNKYTHLQDSNNITSAEGSTGTATITWHKKPLTNGIMGDVRINNHYNSALPNHPSHIEFEIFGLSAENKRKLLLLGLGGGGMLREVNDDDSVEEIRVIDWSNELKYILSSNRAKTLLKNVLNSKKVNLIEGDARQYVNIENSSSKDVIIDNLAYTYMSGASSVKSEEYYKQISRLINKDGIFILGINGRNSVHSKAVISGVLKNFKSVYSLNNVLIASNSCLECFFEQNSSLNETKICPINKSKFFNLFDEHINELPNLYSKLDAQKYLDKFIKHSNENFESITPIKDNFPIYEYYLCLDLINPKCR